MNPSTLPVPDWAYQIAHNRYFNKPDLRLSLTEAAKLIQKQAEAIARAGMPVSLFSQTPRTGAPAHA